MTGHCTMRSRILQRIHNYKCPPSRLYHVSSEACNKSHHDGNQMNQTKRAKLSTPSAGADTTADDDNVFRRQGSATMSITPPRAIFPWRHDSEPLPRLMHGTPECLEQGGVLGPGVPFVLPRYMPFVLETIAGNRLQVPWYQLFGSKWKHELANSCAWAFSQGVAGVLSNTYRVPLDDIKSENEDSNIRFRHMTHEPTNEDGESLSPPKKDEQEDNDYCPEVEYMLEKKLRHLYESAHECGKGQMEIRLQSKPTSAHLQSLFWIPFLTREIVQAHPNLRHSFQVAPEIARQEQQLGRPLTRVEAVRAGIEVGERIADKTIQDFPEGDGWAGTVVAQVSIQCDEAFCVTDLKTGDVVQGHGDEKIRRVTHLVRLENVVESRFPMDGSATIHTVGNWQITDWDDLLDGNLWLSL